MHINTTGKDDSDIETPGKATIVTSAIQLMIVTSTLHVRVTMISAQVRIMLI